LSADQKIPDVAILALGSGLSAISSTTRLIICIVSWEDVHWDMFRYAVENYGSPSLVVFGTLSGPALGVFCIGMLPFFLLPFRISPVYL